MTQQADVAIIGLGPVGATLANCLGSLGISTITLDRESAAYTLPRAVTFDDEIMRLFQILGLADAIQAISEVGSGALFVDAEDRVLVHWDRPMTPTENGWCPNYRFHQPELEAVLREGLTRFDCVQSHWGCEVTDLHQDDSGVTLTYANDSDIKTLRAAYVVGCDGGRSFARGQIGSGLHDLGFHEQWLIADLLLPEPEPDPDRHTYHYCGTPRIGSKVFVGSRRKRWEFRLNPDDDPDSITQPDTVWSILAPWITPREAMLERATVYTFHSMIAQHWRNNRIFLAGDAAHQTPPFMGQGMCAGLRDAANLGWKLAQVLHHDAPDALLDTYQSERFDHVRAYIELTINLGQVINATARSLHQGDTTKTDDGRQTLTRLKPTLGPGPVAGPGDLAGQIFPQLDAALDSAIGYAPALHINTPLSAGLRDQFTQSGCRIVETSDSRQWLDQAGAAAVLVRPDRTILGTAPAGQIDTLLPATWRLPPRAG